MEMPELVPDLDVAGWSAGEVGLYTVHLVPMLVNHRIVLTPTGQSCIWDIGWCYPSLVAAVFALAAWDPTSGDRPAGFTKEVGLLFTWDEIVTRLRHVGAEPEPVSR